MPARKKVEKAQKTGKSTEQLQKQKSAIPAARPAPAAVVAPAAKSDANNLRTRIAELEAEIQRLTAELAEKKASGAGKTADIEARIEELKAKLKSLVRELMILEDEARRAQIVLTRMQTSHDNHEKLLKTIEDQLTRIEAGGRDDVTDMRAELLTMLGELREIKQRRESILHRLHV